MLLAVAKAQSGNLDVPGHPAAARRHHGKRLRGHIHYVAEAFDRDRGLLKFLPQSDQSQHRLRHAAREHLKCNQHADGEPVAFHHQQRAHY